MLLLERCQRENLVGVHSLPYRIRRRIRGGPIPVKRRLWRFITHEPLPVPRLGAPSIFQVGANVRVKSVSEIMETLDDRMMTRGLFWMPLQWEACGKVYRVQSHLRRMIDDFGVWRSVSRTVLVENVTCGTLLPSEACGRECPIFFRDEWLEKVDAQPEAPQRPAPIVATVRSVAEIKRTLDFGGGRDGLKFMPEMFAFAGRTVPARRMHSSGEDGKIVPVSKPFYVLDGLQCLGAIMNGMGPCERRCTFIWHEAWLRVGA